MSLRAETGQLGGLVGVALIRSPVYLETMYARSTPRAV